MSEDKAIDAMHERTEWHANVRALRALWVLVLEAKKRADESYEVLLRLGEELSLLEPAEAWAGPQGPETEEDRQKDPRVFWRHFQPIGPRTVDDGHGGREYRGNMYGPGHPRAPARGERGQWCLSAGTAVQGKNPRYPDERDDGEPRNIELGERCVIAWRNWTNLGGALNEAKAAYEKTLRAMVENAVPFEHDTEAP